MRNEYGYTIRHDEQSWALKSIRMGWVFKDLTSATVDYELGCFVQITDTDLQFRLGFLSTDSKTFVGLWQGMRHSDFSIEVGLSQDLLLTGFGVRRKVQNPTMANQGSLQMFAEGNFTDGRLKTGCFIMEEVPFFEKSARFMFLHEQGNFSVQK